MVKRHVLDAGVKDPRVLQAMAVTPRHEFVASMHRRYAYEDYALPIGHGQTISPPFIVAQMTQMLDPQPTDKVLEIGTGSGYQAAVLSPLVAQVYSIEIVEPLGRRAAQTLQRLGYKNITTRIGDGFAGWPQFAPFDKIIVTCSPENVPQPLVDQLAEGGLMLVPLGERYRQVLYKFRKAEGKLKREALEPTFFVPMTGQAERLRDKMPDHTHPELVNGSFEDMLPDEIHTEGWYYLRGGKIHTAPDAPQGKHVMTFSRGDDLQPGNLLQAVDADGRILKELRIHMQVQGEQVEPAMGPDASPHVMIEFYDELRVPISRQGIGSFSGTFDWTEYASSVRVPPGSRLAVIFLGYNAPSGKLSFDNFRLEVPTGGLTARGVELVNRANGSKTRGRNARNRSARSRTRGARNRNSGAESSRSSRKGSTRSSRSNNRDKKVDGKSADSSRREPD